MDELYNPGMEHGSPAVSFTPPQAPVTTTQPTRSGTGGTLLGALAGGLMDMANNGLSAIYAKNQQKRQMEENQRNRDWQEEMYNKYQSPAAQALQMQKAGLNPAGNVSSQSVGSASTSALPTSSLPGIGAGMMQGAQLALSLRQAKLEERKQAHVEAIGLREQLRKELETASTIEEKNALVNNYRQMFDGLKLDNDSKRINNKYLDSLLSKDVEYKETQVSLVEAQVRFQEAQTEYQNLIAKIAEEKAPHEKRVLEKQAELLRAQATQAYAYALLSDAQAEVAKSSKIKIDNDTQIAKNQEARDAALHVLEVYKQKLINSGLEEDKVNKELENYHKRIMYGDIRTFGELGHSLWYHFAGLIPFSSLK